MGVKDAWAALFNRQNNTNSTVNSESGQPQSRAPVGEIGATGNKIFAGLPMDEYNPDLMFPKSVDVYDEMRRSDGQVAAVLAAITLPIRSTDWRFDPDPDAKDKKLAEDIAHFCEDNFFGGMKYSWDEFMREALLFVPFGFSVFEKVWRMDRWNNRVAVMLDKYAPRVHKSIWRFPQNDRYDVVGVEQIDYMSGNMYTMPMNKVRLFTFNREGNAPEGISALRAAYKHWFYKNSLYQIIATGIEKQLMGTPVGKMPKGAGDAETNKVLAMLTAIRTAQESGIVIPNDVELDILEAKGNIQNLATAFMEHHDVMIARSVLAQFINLGTMSSASGGAYALGNIEVEMFLQSLESIAKYFESEVQHDVEELVTYNWGPDAPVPTLTHKNIGFRDVTKAATALAALGSGHLVNPDVDVENTIRAWFDIPEVSEQMLKNQQVMPPNRYVPETIPDGAMPVPTKEDMALAKQLQQMQGKNQPPGGVPQLHDHEHGIMLSDDQVIPGATGGETPLPVDGKFKRNLTPREHSEHLHNLNSIWHTEEEKLIELQQNVMRNARDQLMTKLQKIVEDTKTSAAQKIRAIQELQPVMEQQYMQTIKTQMVTLFNHGAQSVATEMGTQQASASASGSNVAGLQAKAQELATLQMVKMTSSIKLYATSQLVRGVPAKRLLYGTKQAADSYINGPDLKTSAMITVGEALNIGRGAEAAKIGVQGAQWSAVLDEHTCPLCESLDEKVISVDNPDFDVFRPPLHNGCRCILVYISRDEVGTEFDWKTPPASLVEKYGRLVG